MNVAIVAGEQSGDELGAELMSSLQNKVKDIRFFGVGGVRMQALGLRSLFDQERLAVMGFVEPLKRLPDLWNAKNTVVNECLRIKPDVFIGIDSPDFNLRIEKVLKAQGIKTLHYVSPSVWAWRQGRIKSIRKAVDLMLTLFPFEVDFYQQHQVRALCVGHPLANRIEVLPASRQTIEQLKQTTNIRFLKQSVDQEKIITLMPGSRGGEVRMMGELFLDVAQACLQKNAALRFIIPAANAERWQQLKQLLSMRDQKLTECICLIQGDSHAAMQIADVVLLASGTSTLEAMLLKKPMVVAYRLASASYALAKYLVKTPYIALPNLIAKQPLVPEFIQQAATVENLSASVLQQLEKESLEQLQEKFIEMHDMLRLNASEKAAEAVLQLVKENDI